MSPASLPTHVERVLKDFVGGCGRSFDERLSSVVLYGSAAEGRTHNSSDVNVIVVLHEFRERDVAAMADTVRLARAVIHLDVMYLLVREVPMAVECFAHKFGGIVRRHRMLHGPDPFVGLTPSRTAEIHRLRYLVFNLQLRLRQGYAEHAGHEKELAALLAETAGPLKSCISALARLEGRAESAPLEANSFAEVLKLAQRMRDRAWKLEE